MSALEALISDRKKAGASSGRKRFKLARQRAVAKMRKFALADPSFFVLELIQSAIAHGAAMVHIGSDEEEFSRTGGKFSMIYGRQHYRREELGQLFDFLFTAKGDLENAHLRDLAIGLNALLSFNPKEVQVLTGDGTLKGSTLMSVEDGGNIVELGRPDEPVRGVHVRATGIRHPSVQGAGLSLRRAAKAATIVSVVQERCMLTPVPVVVNGESLSGYSSDRSLPLFGYRNRTALDEGDLYGTIGMTGSYPLRGIRIMVRGVWIETIPHPSDTQGKKGEWKDKEGGYLGGAVSFDRLRKTADHAGIVRDERFRELLARLDPYVARARGVKGAVQAASYQSLEGPLSLRETRELVLASESVVCLVDRLEALSSDRFTSGLTRTGYGPSLRTNATTVEHLTSLSGGRVDIVEVRPGEQTSVAVHLSLGRSPLPPKPWLVESIAVASMGFAEFAASMPSAGDRVRDAAEGRSESPVRMRLFTPVAPEEPDFVLPVQIRIAERTIATHRIPAAHPGHVLVVDLPGFSPDRLWEPRAAQTDKNRAFAAIAERAASLSQGALEAAAQGAIRTLVAGTIEPKSTAAYKALSVISNNGVLRWEFDSEGVAFWVSVPEQWEPLLAAKLLRAVSGETRSLQELGQTMSNNRGQIRWVEDDGRTCSEPKTLRLNSLELHSLTALLGANVLDRYLPTHEPDPEDAYREFVPGKTSADARYQSVRAAQLKMVAQRATGRPTDGGFVQITDGVWLTIDDILGDGNRSGDRSPNRCEVGRRADRILKIPDSAATSQPLFAGPGAHVLRCTPFEMALLSELGLWGDPDGASAGAVYDAELLCPSELDEPGLVGAIGIAYDADVPKLVVVDDSAGTARIGSPARKFGICGRLRVTSAAGLEGRVVEECRRVLERAIVQVANGTDSTGRLGETLLAFTARHMSINDDGGHASPAVSDPIALRVLRLPLFPAAVGLPETALDLIARMRVGKDAPRDERWSPDRRRFAQRLQSLLDESMRFEPTDVSLGSASDDPLEAARERLGLAQPDFHTVLAGWATDVNDVISRYRPDPDGVSIRLRWLPSGLFHVFMGSRSSSLFDPESSFPVPACLAPSSMTDPRSGEQIATVSLLVYAKANELLEAVTNEHERIFQQRVTTALLKGELG
ncbi:MAG: hypothetical protein ACJAYU_000191 [Bradymonadia bacterium]|jgi:hypothetical protein